MSDSVSFTYLTGEAAIEWPKYYVRDLGDVTPDMAAHLPLVADPSLPPGIIESRAMGETYMTITFDPERSKRASWWGRLIARIIGAMP